MPKRSKRFDIGEPGVLSAISNPVRVSPLISGLKVSRLWLEVQDLRRCGLRV